MNESLTPGRVKRAIRQKVKEILLNRTDAGDRVFVARSIPTDVQDLPVILIHTTSEDVSRFDEAPKSYRRSLNLLVECLSYGDDDNDLDGNLEDLADKVESILEVDETLGGLANDLELSGTEYQPEAGGESPTGNLSLRYNVQYFTDAAASELLDDFDGADLGWKVGHNATPADNVIDAQDAIEFEGEN